MVGGEPSETPGAHTLVPVRDGNMEAALADHTLTAAVEQGAADPARGHSPCSGS